MKKYWRNSTFSWCFDLFRISISDPDLFAGSGFFQLWLVLIRTHKNPILSEITGSDCTNKTNSLEKNQLISSRRTLDRTVFCTQMNRWFNWRPFRKCLKNLPFLAGFLFSWNVRRETWKDVCVPYLSIEIFLRI